MFVIVVVIIVVLGKENRSAKFPVLLLCSSHHWMWNDDGGDGTNNDEYRTNNFFVALFCKEFCLVSYFDFYSLFFFDFFYLVLPLIFKIFFFSEMKTVSIFLCFVHILIWEWNITENVIESYFCRIAKTEDLSLLLLSMNETC